MLTLYGDVADENGVLNPWWPGALMDQPARELEALRCIKAAWGSCFEKDRKKREMKAKTKRR